MAVDNAGQDISSFVHRSLLDAYATGDQLTKAARSTAGGTYPDTGLANRLQLTAGLLKAGYGARVYYTIQSGYDTHAAQQNTHANLLRELGGALKAFLDDLATARLADRVLVMTFSEFGRQLQENASAGTDHGAAGPVFIGGSQVRPGLLGQPPNLADLDGGAPKMTVDFRSVYAAILEKWLGVSARTSLAGTFEPLALFR
jgi:uncharacterized protein (DUF1501 family)